MLCIDEIKLDVSFPDAQFHIEGYLGEIEGLIAKRSYAYEDNTSKTICLEVTISKKKWCITFAYRPPYNSNKDGFFNELNKSLSNIARKYENILVVGDLNIDILNKKKNSGKYLSDLCDTSLLSNLILEVICVKSSVGSYRFTQCKQTGQEVFTILT